MAIPAVPVRAVGGEAAPEPVAAEPRNTGPVDIPEPAGAPQAPEAPSWDEAEVTVATLPPFVETEMVYETGHAGTERTWRAIDVWTRNHVYSVDWSMKCIEVRRPDGELVSDSRMLGMYLVGGQTLQDDAIELTYPCPRPGCEAVFRREDGRGFVNTSTVTRVLLRLRVLSVPHADAKPAWEGLSRSTPFPFRSSGD